MTDGSNHLVLVFVTQLNLLLTEYQTQLEVALKACLIYRSGVGCIMANKLLSLGKYGYYPFDRSLEQALHLPPYILN